MVTVRTEVVVELDDVEVHSYFDHQEMVIECAGNNVIMLPRKEAVETLEALLAFAKEHAPGGE